MLFFLDMLQDLNNNSAECRLEPVKLTVTFELDHWRDMLPEVGVLGPWNYFHLPWGSLKGKEAAVVWLTASGQMG